MIPRMHLVRLASVSLIVAISAALSIQPGLAQNYPPAGIPGVPASGAPQQGAAAQSVRIDRLENRVRELTGQVEELQFLTKKLEQQLQKFQQDVDFRLQERGGGAGPAPAARPQAQPRRSEVRPPAVPQPQAQIQQQITPEDPDDDPQDEQRQQAGLAPTVIPAPAIPGAGTPAGRGGRRNDAFDPNENPAAPGAPRTLNPASGPYVPSAPPRRNLPGGPLDNSAAVEDPNAPLELSRPSASRPAARPNVPDPGIAVPNYPGVLPGVPGQQMPGASPAALPAAPPPNRYQTALAALKQNRYDEAEQDFRAFIDQNPKSRSVPDAVFNLGQTYEKRGRHREAAEQYLKVTQAYEKSARAPESMLRLGLSLEKLGAREQACATWQEAGRKYPLAPGYVRTSLEQQQKRAQC